MRYGFPGASYHTMAYDSFKGIVFDPDYIWSDDNTIKSLPHAGRSGSPEWNSLNNSTVCSPAT